MSIYRDFNARAAENEIIRYFKLWLGFIEPHSQGQEIEDVCPPPDREARGAGGCDAMLLRNGRRCAVEITMIEPMDQLQRYGARVELLKPEIEAQVSRAFPASHIVIEIEAEKIPKGQRPDQFAQWIVEQLRLPQPDYGRLASARYVGFRVRFGREEGAEVRPGFRYGLIADVDVDEELKRSVLLKPVICIPFPTASPANALLLHRLLISISRSKSIRILGGFLGGPQPGFIICSCQRHAHGDDLGACGQRPSSMSKDPVSPAP